MRSLIFFCLFSLFTQTALAASQMQQLTNTIAMQMTSFIQGLQQWGTGTMSDAAAEQLFETGLIPTARSLKTNFSQLSRLNNNTGNQQFQNWSNNGVSIFAEWEQVLTKILSSSQAKDLVTLEAVVKQRIPVISQRTGQFMQVLQNANNNNNQSYDNLLKTQREQQMQQQNYQMMSNMSKMQHNTMMGIINNMASPTVDHYENGAFIGNW